MRITPILAVIFSGLMLTACETVEGAGQDISAAGSALSEESRDVQSDL
ncbi:entericidin A/B family lipoprotein [Yoonia algicola]|uniref:Entericidin A/B family lipoprotein n=1 Tax=Yoonia algicola TaxID=3137368 RepID=A0AAN0M2E6_9RHOB